MNERISVVIPVYHSEKYLPECIDSVIGQTYQDLEIILVEDASPDGCGEICDRYAERDRRIRCMHKSRNGGAAEARNAGMDMASGEYLFFMDSDDWLAKDALERLYEGLKRYQADCSVGQTCVVMQDRKGGRGKMRHGRRKSAECKSAHEAMKQVLLTGSAAWNRLYKRKMIEGLRFPAGRINEDEPFMLHAYERMRRIAFLECETYFYRKRENSVTTSPFSVKMVDSLYNSRDNLEFVTGKMPELIPAAEYKYCRRLLWCYVNLRRLRGDERAESLCVQLHREIRKHWKMSLTNPHMEFVLKILTLICLL